MRLALQLRSRATRPLASKKSSTRTRAGASTSTASSTIDDPPWITKSRSPIGFWKEPANQRRYLEWLGKRLGFLTSEDWYRISSRDFKDNSGTTLLHLYHSSPSYAVLRISSDLQYLPWLFHTLPPSIWDEEANRRRYITWLLNQVGLSSPNDLTRGHFELHHGRTLLAKYGYSLSWILESVSSPNTTNAEETASTAWLNPTSNHRNYLDILGKRLGFVNREDWYQVNRADFIANSGAAILNLYSGSYVELLRSIYDDYDYLPWLFVKAPNSYWSSQEARTKYVFWLKSKVGASEISHLTADHFQQNRGSGLLKRYNNSPQRVLDSLISTSGSADIWLRSPKPHNYWNSLENQRSYLDEVGKKIGVHDGDLSPWYIAQDKFLKSLHVSSVLRLYNNSRYLMLIRVYPEYNWIPWRFSKLPRGVLRNARIVESALAFVEDSLNVVRPEEWYEISKAQLLKLGVYSIIRNNGGLFKVLQLYKTEFDWLPWKFSVLPKGLTRSSKLIESALKFAENSLHLTRLEDWYEVSQFQLQQLGIYPFILQNGGLFSVLRRFRPSCDWLPWRFTVFPRVVPERYASEKT